MKRRWQMAEKIKAYMMRVSNYGEVYKGYFGEIENTLKAMQGFVGGHIQVVSLPSGIDLVCGEEGKLMKLMPNRALFHEAGGEDVMYDFVAGNCFCVRHDEEGEFTPILDGDVALIHRFTRPIVFVVNSHLSVTKEENDCVEWKEGYADG